mgnify:CR=1 FL=1
MYHVALRKESVDRNREIYGIAYSAVMSLSARRAWIEIISELQPLIASVSLSARRAWIEIVAYSRLFVWIAVALRKESVDRNA